MQEDLSTIARSTSAFAKSQLEQDIIDKEREKNKASRSSAIKQVGIVFSIVFGAIATLYIILEHIGG